jgi:DNA helicase-2/ATP-dependent DNA helicase PcrA
MPNDVAQDLANSRDGLVIAPAGCGKTHLIADAVAYSSGRQLVLTHTHAGVRAILDHMRRKGLSSTQYRVSTIDGFALRYSSAFPSLSGWTNPNPSGDDWDALRPAAVRALRHKTVRRVVSCSYSGMYVDEYQDCSIGQHDLIRTIAEIIPTRILADPMQAVFWKINASTQMKWADVQAVFRPISELSTPHRWQGTNAELGHWLLEARARLISGGSIDLRDAPVLWEADVGQQNQLKWLMSRLSTSRKSPHSLLGISKWSNQCHHLARFLNGSYASMESVECEDLHKWAKKLEMAQGVERVCNVLDFADVCIARIPQTIKRWKSQIGTAQPPNPRRPDYRVLAKLLEKISRDNDLQLVAEALLALQRLDENLVFARRELWQEMRRSVEESRRSCGRSLSETAWRIRNRGRHIGRHVDRRCLSTTLLVKGLQFDHVVILNAGELDDAENLYVAMTRGSRSLTILSHEPILKRPKPRCVA